MVDISDKLKSNSFPFEIFGTEVASCMLNAADQRNIPPDYMGSVAVFILGALSGGMYVCKMPNGDIKPIIYTTLIGPSGVGKTPAFGALYYDVVKDQMAMEYELYNSAMAEHRRRKKTSKKELPYEGEEPKIGVRMMTDGTPEGMVKTLSNFPSGFGVYYDEAGKIFNLHKYQKTNNGSTDFWNEIWNGKPYHDVKADTERTIYIKNPCVSLCMGIQNDKLDKIITADSISTGLSQRMLFCESDYIILNDNINPFESSGVMCNGWNDVILELNIKGLRRFSKDDRPTEVQFSPDAKIKYRKEYNTLLKHSNKMIQARKRVDISTVMVSYNSKLSQYFGRFCLLMAIYDNSEFPMIEERHIDQALKLYYYYFKVAESVLSKSFEQIKTGLSDILSKALARLPDEFTYGQSVEVCRELNVSDNYIASVCSTYLKQYVRKISKGKYQKV